MKNKKFFLIAAAVVVAALAVALLVPWKPPASPAEDFEYAGTWLGGIEITEYLGTDDVVVVPDKIDGYDVVSIGRSAFAGNELREVYLPEKLQIINYEAFCGCESLEKVHFPKSLRSIYRAAFSHCESLTCLEFEEGLETIEAFAFAECKALEKVALPDSLKCIEALAFMECENLDELVMPGNCLLEYGGAPYVSREYTDSLWPPVTAPTVMVVPKGSALHKQLEEKGLYSGFSSFYGTVCEVEIR